VVSGMSLLCRQPLQDAGHEMRGTPWIIRQSLSR
jgi:hypothetical protein